MDVYALKVPEILTKCQIENYLNQVPKHRQDKYNGYLREEDAIRSICSSMLVRYVVWKELGIKNFSYMYNKYGKPFISEFPNFHFNLSHSHSWVVCAVSSIEVGIDIEKVKEIDLGIAERYFTTFEYQKISQGNYEKQISNFYDYWTMKESFIKNLGKGLSIPLDTFCIRKEQGDYFTYYENTKYYFNKWSFDNEYKIAICSKEQIKNKRTQFINIQDFNYL